jgi:hypothetical protein
MLKGGAAELHSVAGSSAEGQVKSMGEQTLGGCEFDKDRLFGQSTCTNHRNRSKTSADRSTKATLMLTVPRSLIKSSTKDLT